MQTVISEAKLRAMSPAERRELARRLAAIDDLHPLPGVELAVGRRLGLLVSGIACAVLVGWIVVLTLTLHRSFHAQHWKGAWVGFDIVMLFAFAATGWAFWRGRRGVIAWLLVTATLLCCDAWFDVILDLGTRNEWGSVGSAVLVELPLAFLLFIAAGRLLSASTVVAQDAPLAPVRTDPGGPPR